MKLITINSRIFSAKLAIVGRNTFVITADLRTDGVLSLQMTSKKQCHSELVSESHKKRDAIIKLIFMESMFEFCSFLHYIFFNEFKAFIKQKKTPDFSGALNFYFRKEMC